MDTIKRKIRSKQQAEMFALFLACERNRHLDDIYRADHDLENLVKTWGIVIDWHTRYFTVV